MTWHRLGCRSQLLSKAVARLLLLCVIWTIGLHGVAGRAQSSKVTEYDVKAAFLAKFPDFVTWPAAAGPVTVGIVGADPFGGALDKMARVKHAKQVDDLKNCQIIFIPKSEQGNTGAILAALAGTNTLTVGETEGFARQGGAIGFVMDGDKVRFEINNGAARKAGLSIKAQLLKLAIRVIGS